MYSVQESLDDTECDEATDVDVGELTAVLEIPLFNALTLFQTAV